MSTSRTTGGLEVDAALADRLGHDEGRALVARLGTDLVPAMAGVNAGRRRLVRASWLIAGNRSVAPPSPALVAGAVADWGRALTLVQEFADALDADAMAAVDRLLATLDDPTSPALELCRTVATAGMGFSEQEFAWAVAELQRAAFEPLRVVFDGDPVALRAVARSAFTGDNGLLQIGFVDLSDDPAVSDAVRACVARARRAGVTVSVLLLLPAMVLTAAALSTADDPVRRAAAALAPTYARFGGSGG